MQMNARQRALRAGDVLRGEFSVAGSDVVSAGTLRWTSESGAEIRLIGDTRGWPTELGGYDLVVHGVIEGTDRVTLLYSGVREISLINRTTALSSTTLAWGAHLTRETRWSRAVYETASLSGWIADSGLKVQRSKSGRSFGMLFSAPPRRDLNLPRAEAWFTAEPDADPVGYRPDWSIRSRQVLVVNVSRRARVEDLHDRYAIPLICLTSFASDRPDSVISEVVLNLDSGEQAEIWRQGPRHEPEPWHPTRGYLFRADDLPRLRAGLARWWRLHAETAPALGLFADHINLGSTYSQPRFLTLRTAMEGYCRGRFGQNKLELMRDYADVDVAVHGCSRGALALIGATRNYVAHLSKQHIAAAEIIDGLPDSTRRAHALMQACLLRELGFGKRQAETLLRRHQHGWPLPPLPD